MKKRRSEMKMPATKVIKQTPVESLRKTVDRAKPVKVRAVTGAQSELKAPAVRKSRASSCPRCPERDRREEGASGARRTALKQGCDRRARSSSKAPGNKQDGQKVARSARSPNLNPKCQKMSACPREQRGLRGEAKHTIQSHRAFTVIPPNPKKRREIQRKAEAELAALEELRLSRAMAYVSIDPSSVGGCMSLEEVRSKQQQEMMKAKRKQKPMKTRVMGPTPVLEI